MASALNNPAARLLSLIHEGKTAQYSQRTILQAWSVLLNVPVEDTQKLLNRIGYVITIPDKIKEQVKKLDSLDHKIYLKYIDHIKGALYGGFNYNQQWVSVTNYFTQPIMDNLEILSDTLSRNFREKTIETNELKSILEDIEFLIEKIQLVDIPDELRNLINDNLIKIKHSIEEYPICGTGPIQKNVLATVIHMSVIKTDKETESALWKILARIAMVLGITASAVTIAGGGVKLIDYINDDKVINEQSLNEQNNIIDAEVSEV